MANDHTSLITDGVVGPYTVTYGGSDLGILEDAAQIEFTPASDLITGDNLGDTPQDGVYRGISAFFVSMVLQQYNAPGAASAFWPWSSTLWDVGLVGKLMKSFGAALVLTAVSGTTATPTTITMDEAILAPGVPIQMLFGNRLRNVPLRFLILPTVVSGTPDTVQFIETS